MSYLGKNFLVAFLSIVAAQTGPRSSVLHGRMCGSKSSNSHECCTCTTTFGRCNDGDEDPVTGCSGLHASCAEICPGNYSWKQLYNKSKAAEREVWYACDGFPTRNWHTPQPAGRYAVAFSGGLRQFIATYHSWVTNLAEASGGLVDFYFHVWEDDDNRNNVVAREGARLARECPFTKGFVGEKFRQHLQLLNDDQPTLRGVINNTRTSWIGDFDREFDRGEARPYYIGAGYSQWRKVHLALEMVRQSGTEYSLILRARPDHTVLEPLDLREFERHFVNRSAVKKAKGHFIAIAERSKQVITDHWAIGTPEAMYRYATQALPYTVACCEGYVWRGLEMRCFARTPEMIAEDVGDEHLFSKFVAESNHEGPWSLAPPKVRPNMFSPLMLNSGAVHHLGQRVCSAATACVPIYRPRFAYVFKASVGAWFTAAVKTGNTSTALPTLSPRSESSGTAESVPLDGGVLCIQYTNEGEETGEFLLAAGIASRRIPDFETRFNNKPCVLVPTLKKAALAAATYIKTLPAEDQKSILQHYRRIRRLGSCDQSIFEDEDEEIEIEEGEMDKRGGLNDNGDCAPT